MNEISPVSTNLIQKFKSQQTLVNEVKPQDSQPQIASDIVKKETADAVKAYALVAPKPKTYEKKSLDEFKADLIQQGKIEGKDFKIEKIGDKKGFYGSDLTIIENDKPVKTYYYDKDGATKEDFQLVTEYSYPLNTPNLGEGNSPSLKSTETVYDANGKFHFRTNRYERENSPYKDDIVNYNTTPIELEEKLKSAGIKYARDIEYSNDNKNLDTHIITKITAFDPKTNDITRYEFECLEGNDKNSRVLKQFINQDGGIKSYISFNENETSYTEFQNSFIA